MKTYSVKEIAERLGTNPETVRRWIRDDKLKAVQVSRKTGNVVTEDELERFVKATPKYLTRFSAGFSLSALSPALGIGALAAGALLGYLEGKNSVDVRIMPEDFKEYLRNTIKRLNGAIRQKQDLISQTEEEISELSKQVEQYTYLLKNDNLLENTIEKAKINLEE